MNKLASCVMIIALHRSLNGIISTVTKTSCLNTSSRASTLRGNMSSLPVLTDHIIIRNKSYYHLYPAAEHLSPPTTTSRLSDSEVSEPDFEADSHGLNTKEKAKTRAWIRQEAASLSGNGCQ